MFLELFKHLTHSSFIHVFIFPVLSTRYSSRCLRKWTLWWKWPQSSGGDKHTHNRKRLVLDTFGLPGIMGLYLRKRKSIEMCFVFIDLFISSLILSFIQNLSPCAVVSFHGVIELWQPDVLFYGELSAVVGYLTWIVFHSLSILRF